MYPQPIKKLIELFAKLPTVGPRTASRFVFYLLNAPQKEIDDLLISLANLKQQTGICKFCFNPFSKADDSEKQGFCPICSSKTRDRSLLCVIEKESDLEAIEKTKTYKGLYFILGGNAGQLKQKDLQGLRTEELKARLKGKAISEVILATNITTEGETTALYLERVLAPLGLKITRLGRGLPIGSELEYADDETLRQALESRR